EFKTFYGYRFILIEKFDKDGIKRWIYRCNTSKKLKYIHNKWFGRYKDMVISNIGSKVLDGGVNTGSDIEIRKQQGQGFNVEISGRPLGLGITDKLKLKEYLLQDSDRAKSEISMVGSISIRAGPELKILNVLFKISNLNIKSIFAHLKSINIYVIDSLNVLILNSTLKSGTIYSKILNEQKPFGVKCLDGGDKQATIQEKLDFDLFKKKWQEYSDKNKGIWFKGIVKHIVNVVLAFGETNYAKKEVRIRIYPSISGNEFIIFVYIGQENILSFMINRKKEVSLYKKEEIDSRNELAERAREFNYDWLENNFTLKEINKIFMNISNPISKWGRVVEVYNGFIKELSITNEELKILRGNLTTATYYIVKKNVSIEGVVKIYQKEFGLFKNISIELKEAFIIAIYAVAMKKAESSLVTIIELFKIEFGEDIFKTKDVALKKQLIIAVYEITMKKAEDTLVKIFKLFKEEFGEDIFKTDDIE
ncbi:MAG: hypothetical protein KAJ14_13115, partial [Candidatus Omnitrophica bacterium]|nr:hypothetical protein [Candidatus Omnitrophota bacterium]